jgi:hypothetical protein
VVIELAFSPRSSAVLFHIQGVALIVAFLGHILLFHHLKMRGYLGEREVKVVILFLLFCHLLLSIPHYLSFPEGGFSGGFFWHNPMAGLLILALPLYSSHLLILILLTVFLLATMSRGGFLVGAVYLFSDRRRLKLFFLALLTLVLVLLLSPQLRTLFHLKLFELVGRGYTVQSRLAFWSASLKMWAKRPLLGWGWGSFGDVYPSFQTILDYYSVDPHSLICRILAEGGLVGLFFSCLFLWTFGKVERPWSTGLFLLFLHSLMDFDYTFLGILVVASLVWGVGLREIREVFLVKTGWWKRIGAVVVLPSSLLLFLSLVPNEFLGPPDFLYKRGVELRMAGDYDRALGLARRCIWLRKNYPYYWQFLGEVYLDLGEEKEARRSFLRSLELDPWNRPELYYGYYLFLKRIGGDVCEVAEALKERFPLEDPERLANYKIDWKGIPVCGMFGEILKTCALERGDDELLATGENLIDWQVKKE